MQHWQVPDGEQAYSGGNSLARGGGQGGAGDAQMHDHDQQDVQQDVADGGQGKRQKRRAAVTYGVQEAGHEVVGHDQGQTGKDNAQIGARHVHCVFRKVQDTQHGREACLGSDFQHNDRENGQKNALAHGTPEARMVPGAEGLGDLNAEALGQAHGDGEHQPVQPAGAGHGSQGGHALTASDDQGVHKVVELLQNIAGGNGQAESENMPGRPAGGHIPYTGHRKPP